MLRLDQQHDLIKFQKYPNCVFFKFPKVLIRHIISDIAYDPNSDVAKILQYGANSKIDEVIHMLEDNPRLLLEAGDTIDMAGNTFKRTTIYQLLISVGDVDAAKKVGKYFTKIKGIKGEKERLRLYAPYKNEIKNLKHQKPDFDFLPLLQVLKQASNQDVTEEFKTDTYDANYTSPLRTALETMRKHFSPCIIRNGLQFNYANLIKACEIFITECTSLVELGNGYDKCHLFLWQVIGFIQILLPTCDKQAFSQGIYFILIQHEKLLRSFNFRFGGGQFPVTANHGLRKSVGFENAAIAGYQGVPPSAISGITLVPKFFAKKIRKLAQLARLKRKRRVKKLFCLKC